MLKETGTATFVFILTLALSLSVSAQRTFRGEVVDIVDGKTVVVQTTSSKIKVELQFIDVPPEDQLMSNLVREHLRSLVLGKTVEYRPRNILSDHTIGRLMVNSVDVSQQMLRDGAAWHVPARLTGQDEGDFGLYASSEAAAKDEKRGVWGVNDLKPKWERPAVETTGNARPISNNGAANATKPRGPWGDKNPRLGNIGPLVNGYNANSKLGYLSTSLIGVKMLDGQQFDGDLALDITYFYKEGEGKGSRKGIYVVTLVSESGKLHFLKDNDLWAVVGATKINVGRPERSVKNDGTLIRETLKYRVSRDTLEKLVNKDNAYIKVGKNAIYFMNVRYLLYNMLQLAD